MHTGLHVGLSGYLWWL